MFKINATIIVLILLLLIVVSCKKSGQGFGNNEDDFTCWADSAADIVHANDLDQGRNVKDELVLKFGNAPNVVDQPLRWWMDLIGDDSNRVRSPWRRNSDDFDADLQDIFDSGVLAMAFKIPQGKYGHFLTAFKFEDTIGYRFDYVTFILPD
jgi:hypothetical protein